MTRACQCGGIIRQHQLTGEREAWTCNACGRYGAIARERNEMTEAVYVEVLDSLGNPLGSGKVVLWCQTTLRTKIGGCRDGEVWDDQYGQAPCVVLETERGFKVVPLADEWGQATITKAVPTVSAGSSWLADAMTNAIASEVRARNAIREEPK